MVHKPDCVDAEEARKQLAQRGLSFMEKLSSAYQEGWGDMETKRYYSIAYCANGRDQTRFDKEAFDRTLALDDSRR